MPTKAPREIKIVPCLNGYVVHCGCQTVVFESREKLIEQLNRYLVNPNLTEIDYIKNAVNHMIPQLPDDVLRPAVTHLTGESSPEVCVRGVGPVPADTLFSALGPPCDAVVAMYHDQGLIPVKQLDVHRAVNVTLGLPFIRTSPDHGTAYDVAGTGRADPRSMRAAVDLALELATIEKRARKTSR